MPMAAADIERLIKVALPDAVIVLEDLAGDNDHWKATVTSCAFVGKNRVEQQRMVMNAIKDMGTALHALSITTKIA